MDATTQDRRIALHNYLNEKLQALRSQDPIRPRWLFLILVLSALALFTRRPGLFLHPQFYAEDGSVWYAQAYNSGWLHSLTLPEGGYLNTLQRLVAGISLWFPLRRAPLVMVLAGLAIQLLPVAILLSARCRTWAGLPVRLLFAIIYVAMPNAGEIHIVLTNAQWHWALAELLLACAAAPRTWKGRLFDAVIFFTGGFTGPFCIILIPVVLLYGWRRRQQWSFAIAGLMGIGTLVQAVLLLHGARARGVPGGTPSLFLRFIGGDVVEYTIFGSQRFILRAPLELILLATLLGLGVYIYCLRSANLEIKLLIAYCSALFAASLHNPMPSETGPLLPLLLGNIGARYWFFPMLAFAWGVAWCAANGQGRLVRGTSYCILLLMPISAVRHWKYDAYPNVHFGFYVDRMRVARPGEHVVIPIIPMGKTMELIKRAG